MKEIDKWLTQFRKIWETRFNQLDNLLTTISIHDIHGQELIEQTFENATTINVEHLLPGLYYYKLYNLKTARRSGMFLKK